MDTYYTYALLMKHVTNQGIIIFFTEPEIPIDASGCYFYEDKCKKKGIVPVSYLMRNMGEGNLRMRHHYLGGSGTKPLAEALKV